MFEYKRGLNFTQSAEDSVSGGCWLADEDANIEYAGTVDSPDTLPRPVSSGGVVTRPTAYRPIVMIKANGLGNDDVVEVTQPGE